MCQDYLVWSKWAINIIAADIFAAAGALRTIVMDGRYGQKAEIEMEVAAFNCEAGPTARCVCTDDNKAH